MADANKPKTYYLSQTDKKLAGVCGGFAEYFNIDATIVRILAVVLVFLTGGFAIIGYIIIAVVAPKNPNTTPNPPSNGAIQ